MPEKASFETIRSKLYPFLKKFYKDKQITAINNCDFLTTCLIAALLDAGRNNGFERTTNYAQTDYIRLKVLDVGQCVRIRSDILNPEVTTFELFSNDELLYKGSVKFWENGSLRYNYYSDEATKQFLESLEG